jgi:nucleoside-diphosphate-sugar epimerase
LAGIETIFHCAGMVGPPGSLDDYENANVRATVALAELAAAAGVKTLVYVSSLSVYGSVPESKYLDESAPYDARAKDRGVYTQTKLQAEKSLLEFVSSQNGNPLPRVIVLRPGSIYGPGANLPIGRFTLPSSTRRPFVTGGRRVPIALTYIDNFIDALLAAERSDARSGSIYNVVDAVDLEQGELSRVLAQVSGGSIRPIFFPYSLTWMMMLGVDAVAWIRNGKLGTARFRLKRTLADVRFNCTAAKQDLGWKPRVSLNEGLSRAFTGNRETPTSH